MTVASIGVAVITKLILSPLWKQKNLVEQLVWSSKKNWRSVDSTTCTCTDVDERWVLKLLNRIPLSAARPRSPNYSRSILKSSFFNATLPRQRGFEPSSCRLKGDGRHLTDSWHLPARLPTYQNATIYTTCYHTNTNCIPDSELLANTTMP